MIAPFWFDTPTLSNPETGRYVPVLPLETVYPSVILGSFAPMRWLVIGLLVCLGALLLAAGALTRHIWLHRKKLQQEAAASTDAHEPDPEIGP
jgi:hypothetical protein